MNRTYRLWTVITIVLSIFPFVMPGFAEDGDGGGGDGGGTSCYPIQCDCLPCCTTVRTELDLWRNEYKAKVDLAYYYKSVGDQKSEAWSDCLDSCMASTGASNMNECKPQCQDLYDAAMYYSEASGNAATNAHNIWENHYKPLMLEYYNDCLPTCYSSMPAECSGCDSCSQYYNSAMQYWSQAKQNLIDAGELHDNAMALRLQGSTHAAQAKSLSEQAYSERQDCEEDPKSTSQRTGVK